MSHIIQVKLHDKVANFEQSKNILAISSLKSAFLLVEEAVFSLSYDRTGKEINCHMDKKGTCFMLPDDYPNLQFTLKTLRAPATTSTPATASTPVEEPTSRKRRKIDMDLAPQPLDGDTISLISKYAWFYTKRDNLKRSAIPVSRNLAITYRHGENKHLVNGDYIRLSSYQDQEVIVDSYVVLVDESLDLIVLQSKSVELCNRELILESVEPRRGMPYILMGYSVVYGGTSHISFSAGIISSDLTKRLRYLGSSGSFYGDSGGSCWSNGGRLIGMQVETENVPLTTDRDGRSTSPASGGRCEIVSISCICNAIKKFLPPEEHVEFIE